MHSELKTIFLRGSSMGKTTVAAFAAAVASGHTPFGESGRLKRVLRRQAKVRQHSETRKAKRKAQRRARAVTRKRG